ncbi:hypothetical protein LguiB_009098 [Lonicera macranthoides]
MISLSRDFFDVKSNLVPEACLFPNCLLLSFPVLFFFYNKSIYNKAVMIEIIPSNYESFSCLLMLSILLLSELFSVFYFLVEKVLNNSFGIDINVLH